MDGIGLAMASWLALYCRGVTRAGSDVMVSATWVTDGNGTAAAVRNDALFSVCEAGCAEAACDPAAVVMDRVCNERWDAAAARVRTHRTCKLCADTAYAL